MNSMNYKGMKIYARDTDSDPGVATGSTHECQMEGCSGVRVTVKWPDGKVTYPCSKGLFSFLSGLRIQ